MKVTTIVGARPQFIKAAAVSRAIANHNRSAAPERRVAEKIIHTGQHFDANMSAIFFDELKIPKPDRDLGIHSLPHGAMTGRMLEKIEQDLLDDRPDWVLVYGDTNSTLAGALAAAKLHIPVAHVEAGLRSFNRQMPEELNRVAADHLADLLFCPTEAAVANLGNEGITRGVHQVGDVMFDAFLYYRHLSDTGASLLTDLGLAPGAYCLATVHREENTDDPGRLQAILSALCEIGTTGKPVLLPIHPRTRQKISQFQLSQSSNAHLRLIDPVGYREMIALESNAFAILTDSGGVQKEAFFSGIPCITLRSETEWVETVASGWNRLAGADRKSILEAFGKATTMKNQPAPPLYGDGQAAEKILKELMPHG